MFNWLRELMELRISIQERKSELKYCESCETLKMQLALVNQTNKDLLNKILNPIHEIIESSNEEKIEIKQPSHYQSFRLKRQMLEREDRAKAKLMNQKKEETISTKDLENELDIVQAEKEQDAIPRSNA